MPENENPKGHQFQTQATNKIAIPTDKMKNGTYKLYVTDMRAESQGKLFILSLSSVILTPLLMW
ncbi:hypothetical protein HMPREF3232_00600 [Fannyhessea vaginae]|nr:hypothetical protein HMPREF3232_00600 [Fannyhessea vaginae]